MIVFKNKGLLPIEAIKTMGINAKISSECIGYFGTGLKYAISVLLRKGHTVFINIGKTTYQFGTRTTTIREKEFSIVTMNGEDLGFTTELGKNWELWMAYRELYSNCMDEGGSVEQLAGNFNHAAEEDETVISVIGADFEDTHGFREHIFIDSAERTPDLSSPSVDIFFAESDHIFYKGIRALDPGSSCLFTYNIKTHQDLTEDRTLKHPFWIRWILTAETIKSTDKEFIKAILLADKSTFEADFDFSGHVTTNPTNEFLAVAKELLRNPHLNKTVVSFYKKWSYRSELSHISVTTSELDAVARAVNKLEEVGYNLLKYTIRYFDANDDKLSVGDGDVLYIDRDIVERADIDDEDEIRYIMVLLLHAHFQAEGKHSEDGFDIFLIGELLRVWESK